MFVKIGARFLDFWLDKIFWPKWLKSDFESADPNKVQKSIKIWWFDLIQRMILEKMRSFLWKMDLGLSCTYALIHFLGPCGPNPVSRPQVLRSWSIIILFDLSHDSGWQNEVMFVKVGAKGSGLMALYYFSTQGGK